jgi:GntR family transcriptional regulator
MHKDIQSILDSLRVEATGVPLYVQIRDQFLAAIGAGRLGAEAQMPTMRQVAVALAVDLNTVKRAYDALERAGAIRLERGRGTFVADPAAAPAPDRQRLEALAWQAIAGARALGAEPEEFARLILDLAHTKEKM